MERKDGLLPCYEGRQDCAMNIRGKCEALGNMDFDGQCPFFKSKRELPMYETELAFFKTSRENWGDVVKKMTQTGADKQ